MLLLGLFAPTSSRFVSCSSWNFSWLRRLRSIALQMSSPRFGMSQPRNLSNFAEGAVRPR